MTSIFGDTHQPRSLSSNMAGAQPLGLVGIKMPLNDRENRYKKPENRTLLTQKSREIL